MGIGITSNQVVCVNPLLLWRVSIPNGDRHYLEHYVGGVIPPEIGVSIPNGDRHYLEPEGSLRPQGRRARFNPQWG